MIKAEQVPQAVKDAFYNAYWREEATDEEAIAAALNAWPGMAYRYRPSVSLEPQEVILPLTQESGNE